MSGQQTGQRSQDGRQPGPNAAPASSQQSSAGRQPAPLALPAMPSRTDRVAQSSSFAGQGPPHAAVPMQPMQQYDTPAMRQLQAMGLAPSHTQQPAPQSTPGQGPTFQQGPYPAPFPDLQQAPGVRQPQPQPTRLPPAPMTTPAFGLSAETMAHMQQQQLPPATRSTSIGRTQVPSASVPPDAQTGPEPYGLALELTSTGGRLNPIAIRPAAGPAPQSAAARRQEAAARRAQPTPQPINQPQPRAPAFVPPFGGAEPDYGLVAELRGDAPTGRTAGVADTARADFGLAAEVARRRARPDVFPVQGVVGGGLSARPRRRLAAAGPPADFGLAQQLAAKAAAAERDKLDPFNRANRASNVDPFQAADQVLKFPTAPYIPPPPQDQEAPREPVDLLVPPSGASHSSRVSRDSGEYGLAEELGVDPDEARRRRLAATNALLMPPPNLGPLRGYDDLGQPILDHSTGQQALQFLEPNVPRKYTYDEVTGMLVPPEGVEGAGGKGYREYMEDVTTGDFYRINQQGCFRRLTQRFRRKQPREDEELQEGDEGWDPDQGTFRGKLRTAVRGVAAFFSMLGIFLQGLLGGFALLNFFMTYFLYSKDSEWLRYYSPLALASARIYFTLVTLCVIASSSRLAADQLRMFMPLKSSLLSADILQLVCYCVAYAATVLCTPLDDQLTYESNRNAQWYLLSFNSSFKKQLAVWHIFNIIRTIFSGIGWLLCSYQVSPFVRNGQVRYEVHQELLRRTRPPPAWQSPVLAMAGTPDGGDGRAAQGRTDLRSVPVSPTKVAAQVGVAAVKEKGAQGEAGVHGGRQRGGDTTRDQVGLPATHSASGGAAVQVGVHGTAAATAPAGVPSTVAVPPPTGLPPVPGGLQGSRVSSSGAGPGTAAGTQGSQRQASSEIQPVAAGHVGGSGPSGPPTGLPPPPPPPAGAPPAHALTMAASRPSSSHGASRAEAPTKP